MSEVEKLEKKVKRKKYNKSVFNILKDNLGLATQEFQNTVINIFCVPNNGKNQISKEMDKFENKIIKKRKKNS